MSPSRYLVPDLKHVVIFKIEKEQRQKRDSEISERKQNRAVTYFISYNVSFSRHT